MDCLDASLQMLEQAKQMFIAILLKPASENIACRLKVVSYNNVSLIS